jgi:MFS family permease
MFSWYTESSASEKRTFNGCFCGWALDALDLQMFSFAIPAILATFALNRGDAGFISAVTLVSSALGGWLFGALGDRIGRVKTLQITIVWFSIACFLCAFAQNFPQLVFLKALQGFGFGGEWAAGAVLMSEMIRPENRGRALGTVQSAWAVGWGASVLLFQMWPAEQAWRIMFAFGLVPALFVLYVRRGIPEPLPPAARTGNAFTKPFQIFSRDSLRMTLVGGLLGTGAHGGYYAVMTWIPTFLRDERKLSILGVGGSLAVVILAFFCGCIASAYLLDRIGRRRNIAIFAVCCVITVLVYIFVPMGQTAMLAMGFPLGFFAAGIPASMGALFSELYPTGIRGTGVGFCYNAGRIVSAAFPWLVGLMSDHMSLGAAIGIDAAIAYSLVVVAVVMLPETAASSLKTAQSPSPAGGHPVPAE